MENEAVVTIHIRLIVILTNLAISYTNLAIHFGLVFKLVYISTFNLSIIY